MSLHPEPLALNLGLKPQPHLQPRAVEYKTTLLPTIYGRQNTSPAPATVVGIVLGTVGGFIFLFYLLYIALNAGKVVDGPVEEVVVRRGGSRSRSRSRSPVRSRKRGYPRSSRREVDVVEVEQTRARERETVRPVSGGRRSSGWRRGEEEGIVVDESVTSATGSRDGGTVEVLEEENSEVSRPGRRSSYRDPLAYGSLGRSGRRGSGRYR